MDIAQHRTRTPSNGDHACQWISLTPVRNESWIIKTFLDAAMCWADHVVVADQLSTDGTRQMLQQTSGVDLVMNDSTIFDEARRQHLLIDAARRKPDKRILVALDADEALSANCLESSEWKKIEAAKPGTVLRFKWVNILPGFKEAWIPPQPTAFGFIDDGSAHVAGRIHSPRIPCPPNAPVLDLQEIVVLHFQYVVWERMVSKQRWYQAWEALNFPQKGPLQIYRQYNHMRGSWNDSEIHPVKPEWLESYFTKGIDYRKLQCEETTWWDSEIAQMLVEHGPKRFRKIAIWDKDWSKSAKSLGMNTCDLSDPRSKLEKWVHRRLEETQERRSQWNVRLLEGMLRRIGW